MSNTHGQVYDYGYFTDTPELKEYVVSLTQCVAEAGGFIAVQDPNAQPLPQGSKMRHVTVQGIVTGRRRQIPVHTMDTDLFRGDVAQVSFGDDGSGNDELCDVVSYIGEEGFLGG